MKQVTLNQFSAESNLPAKLIRAVVRQIGGWDAFKQAAPDICGHGIDGGFSGFIYHTDTVSFARRHKQLILDMAKDLAEDLGEDVFVMIANFNCLKLTSVEVAAGLYDTRSEDRTQVFNALAWFAGEEVARSYCDLTEQ